MSTLHQVITIQSNMHATIVEFNHWHVVTNTSIKLLKASNGRMLQQTRTKQKANTFNVFCIAHAATNPLPVSNVSQGSPCNKVGCKALL